MNRRISTPVIFGALLVACSQGSPPAFDAALDGTIDGGPAEAMAAEGGPADADGKVSLAIEKTIKLDRATIWSGLSTDGSDIQFTTMFDRHIQLKRFDKDLVETQPNVQLTLESDLLVGHIDDHQHLFLGGTYYVAFSSSQNKNGLWLFRSGADGKRIGELVTEVTGSDLPTNDPHLFTDGTSVYLMYGMSGDSRILATYDLSLKRKSGVTLTMSERRGQLGSTMFHDGGFYMFTGDETQQNLTLSRWDNAWKEASPFGLKLIGGDPSTWNYFASGSQHEPASGRWFIGYHVFRTSVRDSDTVTLAAFDRNFALLGNLTIGQQGTFRPHVLLLGGAAFVAYDSIGSVYLTKVRLSDP